MTPTFKNGSWHSHAVKEIVWHLAQTKRGQNYIEERKRWGFENLPRHQRSLWRQWKQQWDAVPGNTAEI